MKKVLLVLAICFIGLSSKISFSQVNSIVILDSLSYKQNDITNPNLQFRKENLKGENKGGFDKEITSEYSGTTFSLIGRKSENLSIPAPKEDEEEFIVVTIWVNPEGKVTRAVAGARGTTMDNRFLWRSCESAALLSTFSENPNAPFEQKGTITYKFKK